MKFIYETKLDDEIIDQIEFIKKIDIATEEGVKATECVSKLIDRSVRLKELEIEKDIQIRKINDEYELKLKEIESSKQSQILDLGVRLAIFVGSSCLYLYAHRSSLRFEKDDSASFTTTKELMRKGLSLLKLS